MFARVQDGVVAEVRGCLPREWNGIQYFSSLPLKSLAALGWFVLVKIDAQIDDRVEELGPVVYEILEDRVQAVRSAVLKAASAVIAAKVDEVDDHAMRLRAKAVGRVHPAEMSLWQEKYQQAKAFQAAVQAGDPTPASACPDLVVEAQYRQVSLVALVTRIIQKGNAYKALEAQLAGVNGRHTDAIKATDPATFPTQKDGLLAVATYDFSQGWPTV